MTEEVVVHDFDIADDSWMMKVIERANGLGLDGLRVVEIAVFPTDFKTRDLRVVFRVKRVEAEEVGSPPALGAERMHADTVRDEYGNCIRPAVFLSRDTAKRQYQDARRATLIVEQPKRRKKT